MRHAQRGQVLPIWIMGILGTIALIVTALNYGNSLRWHIRAQSAADSAAQAVLALQSQRWNEMMELLYGMNVEEYRIRHLLDGILVASSLSGGCFNTQSTSQADDLNDCEAVYDVLTPQYLKAVTRYSKEAALLHKVAYNAQYRFWLNDANSLLNHIAQTGTCNNVGQLPYNNDGGDCSMTYHMITSLQRSQATVGTGLSTVYENATQINIPSYGATTSYGNDTEDPNLFAPLQVDIVTCSKVPPLLPAFGNYMPHTTYAIGRAAATNVLFVQDWFQPGGLVNPYRTTTAPGAKGEQIDFQPQENYGTPARPAAADHDYYSVDFAGNGSSDDTYHGIFFNAVFHDEMSVRTGWWNSIPVHASNTSVVPTVAADCPA